jgi:hypothetical protein
MGDWVIGYWVGRGIAVIAPWRILNHSYRQCLATTNGVRWFLTFELPIELAILNFELVILNCLA